MLGRKRAARGVRGLRSSPGTQRARGEGRGARQPVINDGAVTHPPGRMAHGDAGTAGRRCALNWDHLPRTNKPTPGLCVAGSSKDLVPRGDGDRRESGRSARCSELSSAEAERSRDRTLLLPGARGLLTHLPWARLLVPARGAHADPGETR